MSTGGNSTLLPALLHRAHSHCQHPQHNGQASNLSVYPTPTPWQSSTEGKGEGEGGRSTGADTDFGAVMYITAVLVFYSLGIVVMIVKYLKTERKEMEEEMVLDSFFKGIPSKKIEHNRDAVNRVAIRAFHTLTSGAARQDQLLKSGEAGAAAGAGCRGTEDRTAGDAGSEDDDDGGVFPDPGDPGSGGEWSPGVPQRDRSRYLPRVSLMFRDARSNDRRKMQEMGRSPLASDSAELSSVQGSPRLSSFFSFTQGQDGHHTGACLDGDWDHSDSSSPLQRDRFEVRSETLHHSSKRPRHGKPSHDGRAPWKSPGAGAVRFADDDSPPEPRIAENEQRPSRSSCRTEGKASTSRSSRGQSRPQAGHTNTPYPVVNKDTPYSVVNKDTPYCVDTPYSVINKDTPYSTGKTNLACDKNTPNSAGHKHTPCSERNPSSSATLNEVALNDVGEECDHVGGGDDRLHRLVNSKPTTTRTQSSVQNNGRLSAVGPKPANDGGNHECDPTLTSSVHSNSGAGRLFAAGPKPEGDGGDHECNSTTTSSSLQSNIGGGRLSAAVPGGECNPSSTSGCHECHGSTAMVVGGRGGDWMVESTVIVIPSPGAVGSPRRLLVSDV